VGAHKQGQGLRPDATEWTAQELADRSGNKIQTSKRLEVVEGIHPAPVTNTPYIKSALEVAGIGTPTRSTCNPNLTCIAWSGMSGEPAAPSTLAEIFKPAECVNCFEAYWYETG
jgi:hypothetical protein